MINLNFGLLGHVDSGKTTLAKALSTVGSTGAFDKHANEVKNIRANTIDLGFSSLSIDGTTISLIDCPGHGSLIKAVFIAASVFDGAIILINAVKGIEVQTVEHLLLASVLCSEKVIIVLNKTDLVQKEKYEMFIKKLPKLLKTLNISEQTKIIATSLMEGNEKGLENLLKALKDILFEPIRKVDNKLIMSVDHCFPIKGKGTVATGTIVKGQIKVNDLIEVPELGQTCKVKEIQCWKKPVAKATAGQRAALLFSSFPNHDLSRFIICSVGAMKKINKCLVKINKIPSFKFNIKNRSKMHIYIGFEAAMAECKFYLKTAEGDFEHKESLNEGCSHALLIFDGPVFVSEDIFLMAAKLDIQDSQACRFAFYSTSVECIEEESSLKVFKRKQKEGVVDRVENERSLICKNMFKPETNLNIFINMKVVFETGLTGTITSSFGKSAKFRIELERELSEEEVNHIKKVKLFLYLKKYIHSNFLLSYIPSPR
uniref:Tr-type G domain-containing protein n=1 Tax=Rhabditophanes sp. KR3021 TaxID=114890 RepID=A0AC35TP08_9BILA